MLRIVRTPTRNVKIFAVVVAALVVTGVAVALVYVTLIDHKELRYKTQAALLAAIPRTATGELAKRGVTLAVPLGCWSMPEATPRNLRVACVSQTVKGKRVKVIGAGEHRVQEQYFTILVEGRPLVQNAGCLGADCHPRPSR
jgi:hypothetical protein